jgi:hypothetical protein
MFELTVCHLGTSSFSLQCPGEYCDKYATARLTIESGATQCHRGIVSSSKYITCIRVNRSFPVPTHDVRLSVLLAEQTHGPRADLI